MKTNILFTLIFIGLITWKAQAQYNQNDLVGMWQVNVPKLLKSLPESRKEKMDANQELLSMMFLSNAFQLKKDGSTITQRPSFSGNSKTKQGKWQLTGKILSLTNEKGKVSKMHLLEVTKDRFIAKNPDKPEQEAEFISLKSILKSMTKTNQAQATQAQLIGDWKLAAFESKGKTFAFGITYTLASDGTHKITTVLGKTDPQLNGTWKMTEKNTFEVKTPRETSTFKIVYFTPNQMIAIDNKGEKARFDRIK